MGNQAYGRELFVFAAAEEALGTYKPPSGADAIDVINCDMEFKPERVRVAAKTSLRQQLTKVNRRKSGTWNIEKYLLPSGAAGTEPDDTLLWEALFGKKAVTAGESVAYSLTKEPARSLSILRQYGPHQEAVCGAVPGTLGIRFGGGDEPKVTFGGACCDHLFSGSGALTAAASATKEITVADAAQFCVGLRVKVGSEDNTGKGFLIEGVDVETNKLTLDGTVANQPKDAVVAPYNVTPVTAGDIMAVTAGEVTLAGETIYLTGCSVDIDQAPKLRNDEFGYATPRGLRYPDPRVVKCTLDLYFESGAAKWVNKAKNYTALDLAITLGSAAGKTCEIALKSIEFDIPSVKIPEADEATVSLSGQADGTATGDDECVVTFK